MQLIEIYDENDYRKNIYGALHFQPEKVVFIHPNNTRADHLEAHQNVLQTRLPHSQIHFVSVDFSNFEQMEQAVKDIANQYKGESCLDLYGGEEIANIFIKNCCEKMGFGIIHIDPTQEKIVRWGEKRRVEKVEFPTVSLREIIQLHGADVINQLHHEPEEDFYDNVLAMSEYIFQNQSTWKNTSYYFQHCIAKRFFKDELSLTAPTEFVSHNKKRSCNIPLLKKFLEYGFLTHLHFSERDKRRYVSMRIRNQYAKQMLITTGSWLESYLYVLAKNSKCFSEVHQSIQIDWDGKQSVHDVINEIDLVLLKNGLPIFVSCKMKNYSVESINELEVCANEFGGIHSKKVLVTTECNEKRGARYYRCQELGIHVLDAGMLTKSRILEFFQKL